MKGKVEASPIQTPWIPSRILCQDNLQCRWTFMERFENAPFPYEGRDEKGQPFWNGEKASAGERFHITSDGNHFSEADHYRDNSVLFHIPPQFDPQKNWAFVVYFHGHGSIIPDQLDEYQILDQINQSQQNVVLIAPQLAKNAADSSPGKFYQAGSFQRFIDEASQLMFKLYPELKENSRKPRPIFMIAFSGGYKPLAFILDQRGETDNIRGILLLDALYGEVEKYQHWIEGHLKHSFFVSLYSTTTEQNHRKLIAKIQRKITLSAYSSASLRQGRLYLQKVSTPHLQIPLWGTPYYPLKDFLKNVGIESP